MEALQREVSQLRREVRELTERLRKLEQKKSPRLFPALPIPKYPPHRI